MNFTDQVAQKNASLRKKAHIEFAEKSQTLNSSVDQRFNYEPLYVQFPKETDKFPVRFLNFTFDYPFWVSSMTGGTEHAKKINRNLALLCQKFNLGMGLGSCRSLLTSHEKIEDFDVRSYLGDRPLFANIGIAQLEDIILKGQSRLLGELINKLEANGLIIHINPLQEWFQPEGDRLQLSPIETLSRFVENFKFPIIVKEVGQGMGPKSLNALLKLPIAGIEFAAFGGTNFSHLEKMRQVGSGDNKDTGLIYVGHTIDDMIENLQGLSSHDKCFIVSGGIKSPLDAFYYLKKIESNALIGMANSFLAPAMESEQALYDYFSDFKNSFLMASRILEIKGHR
jgi:isopentenyl-diphosphate delta-isomerase